MKVIDRKKYAYSKHITALLLSFVVIILSLRCITNDCYWGDDYAAYITEGIALSEGTLDKQSSLNTFMHPSPLPDEAIGKPLVYVWGYPLILSAVYNSLGFDRNNYNTIYYYKLPSVIAFALLASLIFYFFRSRLTQRLSAFLALIFCTCVEFYDFLNTLYSDMVFLFFAFLSILLTEKYLNSTEKKRRIIFGLFLSLSLWYMYEVRLNGIAILLCCFFAHLVYSLYDKSYRQPAKFLVGLLPYLLFAALKIVSEKLIAAPTSNTSDFSGASVDVFFANLRTYYQITSSWIISCWNSFLINPLYSILRRITDIDFEAFSGLSCVCLVLSYALFILGIIKAEKKHDLHLILLVFIYIVAAALLPYTQGLRYIYPLLPIILLFIGIGYAWLCEKIVKINGRMHRYGASVLTVMLCFLCVYSAYSNNPKGLKETAIVNIEDIYMQNAYSPAAVEVYHYIESSTPSDCTVAFFAPRGLYLNTQRLSFNPGSNGHSVDEADYFLEYLKTGEYSLYHDYENGYELVFSNEEFKLYKLNK